MLGTNAEQQCRKILEKNDYTVVRKLGKGGFGHVLLANKFTTCTNSYAIKCISLKKCAKDQHLKQSIAQETRAMSSLDHQHIVRLQNNFSDFGFHFLVMEFCDLGNLMVYQAKQPNKVLGLSEALNILLQVMKGTQAMHDCNIIHRDLKCENIFLKKNKGGSYTCKIGDFGFAKVVEDTTSTSCGTIYFMAPQVIANRPYDRQADIWSLGVILFYMLFGQHPFKSLNILKQIESKCADGYNVEDYKNILFKNEKDGELLKDFFKRIFCINPRERIKLNQMFHHKLFQGPDSEETSDSILDDQFEDIQWELEKIQFIEQVKRDVQKIDSIQMFVVLGFKFYLSKVCLTFLYSDQVYKFLKEQRKSKLGKEIQKKIDSLQLQMENAMPILHSFKNDLKCIDRFGQGFNMKVQEFKQFKQGYRNTVGKVYECIHKISNENKKSQLKFRLFCCHLVNRVFKNQIKEDIFPYFTSWLSYKKYPIVKTIDFKLFNEWIRQETPQNLVSSVDNLNNTFYRKQ